MRGRIKPVQEKNKDGNLFVPFYFHSQLHILVASSGSTR